MVTRLERFNAKVIPVGEAGCLKWTASLTAGGYGNFTWSTRRPMKAHQAAWLLADYELPSWPLVLDHLCGNRWCVNVTHLEIVTRSVNCLRGKRYMNKDTCRAGLHPWTEENTVLLRTGYRTCRPCRDLDHQAWLSRH